MEITLGSWRLAIEQIPPTVDELSEKYNMAAPSWHQSIERMGFIDAYRSLFGQMRRNGRLASPSDRLSVLDVGIGTGGLLQAFLDQENRQIDLTGVDISAQMLTQAENHLANRVCTLNLYQQDVEQLRLQDNQFDCVMCAHVLEHLPDVRKGLREMIRVAKSGAPVLLIITRRSLASAWLHLIWQIQPVDVREIVAIFDELGLQNVEVMRFTQPVWCNWMSIAIVGRKT